jgi:hypothetical protein
VEGNAGQAVGPRRLIRCGVPRSAAGLLPWDNCKTKGGLKLAGEAGIRSDYEAIASYNDVNGYDIAYDAKGKCFWVAGQNLTSHYRCFELKGRQNHVGQNPKVRGCNCDFACRH